MQGNSVYQQQQFTYRPKVCRNNLVTTDEKVKCVFEMFVIYHPGIPRKYPPADMWTHRGDQFNDTPPERYLGSLFQRFLREVAMYKKAVIRNNSKPFDHPDHEVFVYTEGIVQINNLGLHDELLKYMYKKIPPELEWKAVKEWRKNL